MEEPRSWLCVVSSDLEGIAFKSECRKIGEEEKEEEEEQDGDEGEEEQQEEQRLSDNDDRDMDEAKPKDPPKEDKAMLSLLSF